MNKEPIKEKIIEIISKHYGIKEEWAKEDANKILELLKDQNQNCQKHIDAEGTIAFQLYQRKIKEYKEEIKKMIEEITNLPEGKSYSQKELVSLIKSWKKKLENL